MYLLFSLLLSFNPINIKFLKNNFNENFNTNINSIQFNLNKDSLWLSFPLKTTSFKFISNKIPKTHRIAKCKVFEEDKLDYRLFFNFFEVKTPFFSGNRLEIVTIANNIIDNTKSFVILDCYTNVISWDPISGLQKPNCKIDKKITNTIYNVKLNNCDENIFKLLSFKTNIWKKVLKEFSIYPNYICYFKNYPKGYKLLFNKKQIDKKVILLKDIKLKNYIYKLYIKDLEYAFIYPQKMNFKVFLK